MLHYKPLYVILLITLISISTGAILINSRLNTTKTIYKENEPITICELTLGIDPIPVTEFIQTTEQPIKNIEKLKLIGRMAEGIRSLVHQRSDDQWWECGRVYTEEEEVNAAIEWASRIVQLSNEYSDHGSDKGRDINPWGVAGTVANETNFDRCALGKWPRKWGYERGIIQKSRRGISHSLEDVKRVLNHPDGDRRWRTIGIDAAPLHVLWRCADGKCAPKWNREGLPAIPLADVFSLGLGFEYNVREMKKRALDYRTDRPWLYWRGSRTEWYDRKVTQYARRMGATRKEI